MECAKSKGGTMEKGSKWILVGVAGIILIMSLYGCKQLVKMDNPNLNVSSCTVNVPINMSSNTITGVVIKATATVKIGLNDNKLTGIVIKSSSTAIGSNNSLSVSSGAFSNNSVNLIVSSSTAKAFLETFLREAKWYHYLFILLVLLFVGGILGILYKMGIIKFQKGVK